MLLGHLLGDYIFQDDFMATNKAKKGGLGLLACLVHVAMYTICVAGFTWPWMPWSGLVFVAVTHFFMDRYRIAAWWMKNCSHQESFATNLAPWSIIVVDNVIHLFTLWLVAAFAGKVTF